MTDIAWGKKLWDYRKNLGISRKKFAEQLDINEGTLRSYETEQRKPGYETYQKIQTVISNQQVEGDDYMNDLIRTKDRLIQSLENEKRLMSQLLESKTTEKVEPTNAYKMDAPDAQLHFNLKMNWKGRISVCYLDMNNNAEKFGVKLGYSVEEIYDILMIGQMVDYGEHNIHRLRSEKQKSEMLEMLKNYITLLSKVKMTTSSITAEIPVPYTAKDGTPYVASCEYSINWVNNKGVCNIRFMK